jgi:outer membrane protein
VRLTALALALALAGALSAQTPTKVGIIHIQNAIIGTKEGQKALKDLEAKAAPKKAELERRQAEIQALQEKLNKASNVGGDDVKAGLMRDIDQKTKAFRRDVDDAQADLDQENQKVINTIGQGLMAVLDKYAKDNGYAIILDVSNQQTSNVLFAANGTDVTQEIVVLYDKNSGTAPAVSSTPKPVTPAPAKPSVTPPAPATPVKK